MLRPFCLSQSAHRWLTMKNALAYCIMKLIAGMIGFSYRPQIKKSLTNSIKIDLSFQL